MKHQEEFDNLVPCDECGQCDSIFIPTAGKTLCAGCRGEKTDAYKRATLAWLRLEFAVQSLDQGEAERGLRDLLFALGASTCVETENGDGSATLTFNGLGRKPGRRLRIKVEVLHG